MNRVTVIALTEVRNYLQDRADLVFSLFLPIAIFALMYGAFSGQTTFNGTAHIVNDDQDGIYSRLLIERLSEKEELEVELLTRDEADTKLANSDILLYAYIPASFSAQLSAGWPTEIILRQRGNAGMEGQIVASLVRSEADRISHEMQIERQVMSAMSGKPVSREQIETTVRRLLERERQLPTVAVVETPVGGEFNPVRQFLPGIVTMFVLFAVTLTSRAIIEERRKGTLERLLTTRLSIGELYAGKFLAGTTRGFIQTSILLALAYAVFRLFTPVSFISALFIALVFAAAASTLGLIIASVARTEDQAISMSVFFTMATVMLGGTFFEIPKDSVFYAIGKASINTYVNSALETMMTPGGNLGDVTVELAVLGSVVVAGLIVSRVLFHATGGG
ncbi:MAG TPA: ABC transporter permease [Dehalococcoidia bacterium]|nr:ABC transporter permease [Dehalococcoidia bacterium]